MSEQIEKQEERLTKDELADLQLFAEEETRDCDPLCMTCRTIRAARIVLKVLAAPPVSKGDISHE